MSKTITQPISFQIDNDKQAVIVVINTDSKVVTFPVSFEEMNSISEEAKLVQERINGKKKKSSERIYILRCHKRQNNYNRRFNSKA